jgi:formate C-acetyltransferase
MAGAIFNGLLYRQLKDRSYRAFRRPFDVSRAAVFTDPSLPPVTRMALRMRELFRQEEPVILEGQRIVFLRTVTGVPDIFSEKEWQEIRASHRIHECGYLSNICADYGSAVASGLDGRKEQIEDRLRAAKRQGDAEGILFLDAALSQIEAVFYLVEKYKNKALELGREDIAETLSALPHRGARTFREALQLFRILHYTLWAEGEYHNTVGRFDQFAWPYMKRDMEEGRLTRKEAEDLVEEFFISFNWDSDLYRGVQQGDNGQSMMLGGVDESGNDAYNELSEICLRTSHRLGLIDPKINLRVSSGTPIERFVEATRLTGAGLGFPQYSNDDVVIPALEKLGYETKDARNYTVAACWEFIIPGLGMEIPNIGALSYPEAVEKAMLDGLEDCKDFEEFKDRVRAEISAEADSICAGLGGLYIIPAPFYSILMDGCIGRARDITLGSKYNNYGFHGSGLATAADSMEAIRHHVFELGDVTAKDMKEAVLRDFDGYEELLHSVRYEDSKLGDNDPRVNALAAELMEWFADALEGRRNERGGRIRPGTGTAMFYLWDVKKLAASADGRRKDEALGTNFSPSLFVRSKGPFSVIQSFASLPVSRNINGGPLTMEFHSSVFDTEEGIEAVASLVRQFVILGGHQLQLNSVNRERLIDAQKHPENYSNLIVRIWGWSAYFVELDREYQDHLIARQEFDA